MSSWKLHFSKKTTGQQAEQHASFVVAGLDEALEKLRADTANPGSDRELRRSFADYNLHYDPAALALPQARSAAYRELVLELYRRISGREYDPERTELSDSAAFTGRSDSFPYCTGSPGLTALNLEMIASVLRLCNGLPPGARILEFGPGWGELTLALARLGFRVTCIDVEERFLALIRSRAEMLGVSGISTVRGSFHALAGLENGFDAIVFFESFHHEIFHYELLEKCLARLRPEGIIILAGEPVSPANPVPWGLRLDGQSLWSIAVNGWMELGFSSDYFEAMLTDLGLLFVKQATPEINCRSYLAARTLRLDFENAAFAGLVGKRAGSGMSADGRPGILVYGPYLHLGAGQYSLQCFYRQPDTVGDESAQVRLHLWHSQGSEVLLSRLLDPGEMTRVHFTLPREVSNLEFVIETGPKSVFTFDHFLLSRDSGH